MLVVSGIAVRAALVGLFALYLSYALRRASVHDVPVGRVAAGGWIPGHLSHRRLPHRGLALPLVAVPLLVHGRRCKAGFGRRATWRNLTALEYHFETQPPPTPLAWYAAHLPQWTLVGGTAAALVIEVGVAFSHLCSSACARQGLGASRASQSLIALTGN